MLDAGFTHKEANNGGGMYDLSSQANALESSYKRQLSSVLHSGKNTFFHMAVNQQLSVSKYLFCKLKAFPDLMLLFC